MLSKCANPTCSTPLLYLREGKIFLLELDEVRGPQLVSEKKAPHRVEHFWLCGPCSQHLTLKFEAGQGVITVPKAMPAMRRAAAS